MLRSLDIRDLLIIDRLELTFQSGLNVLTGETGAGKSILLDSLGFVLGWRGRAELVRSGADQGEVTAVFDLPAGHAAHHVLEEAGLPASDELILRRVNARDGRKTAWVNDRRCSGDILRALSSTLVELHGQHDDRGLLDPKGHRVLLDTFARADAAKAQTRQCWRALGAAQKELAEAVAALEAVRSEEEFLRHAVSELDALDPQPGEDAELDSRRRMMQGAEKVRETISRAQKAMGQEGAEGAAGEALRWLEDAMPEVDELLNGPFAALERAMFELGEASDGVMRCLEVLDFNPLELEQIEERLFAIRGLARKHGQTSDELGVFADGLRTKLTALDAGADNIDALQVEVKNALSEYSFASEALGKLRRDAASRLDQAVTKELSPLKMERAVFETRITPTDPGPDGSDLVAFRVATNPGAPAGPLGKIASGGELSRFLLALKMCLTADESGITMIFDEIDRGVGGATADAVGRRLAELASDSQVLVVTHSPQVAALGDHHWRVEKRVEKATTLSRVVPLDPSQRVDEIARMLSGDTVTDQARAAAQALLTGTAH